MASLFATDVKWRCLIINPVLSALKTLRTSIHPIPDRHPVETIVVRSVPHDETQAASVPLVTVPHGGPHAGTTTAFSASTTALVLEGCE